MFESSKKYKEEFFVSLKDIFMKPESEWSKQEKSLIYEARIVYLTHKGFPKRFKKNVDKKYKDITKKELDEWISFGKKVGEDTLREWIKKNVPKTEREFYICALNALLGKFLK